MDRRASHASPGVYHLHLWAYFRNTYARDEGLKIDHFLLSSEAAERLLKAEVDKHVRGWERSNDHEFVWIELCRLTCEEEDAQMTDSGCRGGMRLKLEDFIDGFVAAGANQKDTFEAIAAEIENMRVSYERELDPADDDAAIVDEPSNDCPTDD